MLGGRRPELHHQLRARDGDGQDRPAGGRGLLASMTYGGSVPTITPSYSGFVNGDSAASLTSRADLLHHRHLVEPGRDLPGLCSGAVDPNYTITYVPGVGSSARPPSSITASSGTMTYGGVGRRPSRLVLGLRERGQRLVAHHQAHVHHHGHARRARWAATPRRARGRSDPNYTISTWPA